MILYHTGEQKQQAFVSKEKIEKEEMYTDPIVTEIQPFEHFYTAEEYHQNYYDSNQNAPYCSLVIAPKIKKLLEKFGSEVKEEYKK